MREAHLASCSNPHAQFRYFHSSVERPVDAMMAIAKELNAAAAVLTDNVLSVAPAILIVNCWLNASGILTTSGAMYTTMLLVGSGFGPAVLLIKSPALFTVRRAGAILKKGNKGDSFYTLNEASVVRQLQREFPTAQFKVKFEWIGWVSNCHVALWARPAARPTARTLPWKATVQNSRCGGRISPRSRSTTRSWRLRWCGMGCGGREGRISE